MGKLFLIGIPPGTDCGAISVTTGSTTKSGTFNAFQMPAILTAHPFLSDAVVGDTITIDETGLTGPPTRQWISNGVDIVGETGATLDSTGRAMEKISVRVTCDQGTLTSPAITVMMSGSHNSANRAIMKCLSHNEITHYSVADGPWSNPATWNTNSVPMSGARVLVSCDTSVDYDISEANLRLDRVRVDGTLTFPADVSSEMLVETLIGAMGSTITIGTGDDDRVAVGSQCNITTSGRHYRSGSLVATDIDNTHFVDTEGWARGFISLGVVRAWGKDKVTHYQAEPINAGAESLTLRSDPVGLEVGDTLVIGGTDIDASGNTLVKEDEEVVVTDITGRVVSWSGPLVYPHKNQLSTSTRTDLYPSVMVRDGKNICLKSEVEYPTYRRGHFANMHHMSVADLNDMSSINMGRTDKSKATGILSGGQFKRHTSIDDDTIVLEALTSQSNLQGRYSFHFHQAGFPEDPEDPSIPTVNQCYAEGAAGWGYVHHDTWARFRGSASYKHYGCGFVAESANEIGPWSDCIAMGAEGTWPGGITNSPKVHSGPGHKSGNRFIHGYGFGLTGRKVNMTSNVAVSCTWGVVFLHRDGRTDAENLSPHKDLIRSLVDIGDAGVADVQTYGADDRSTFNSTDMPILSFTDCKSIACLGGAFVTKSDPNQGHDISVIWKNFQAFGFSHYGINNEYVSTYIIDHADLVAGENGRGSAKGGHFGGNALQMGHRGSRVEGCDTAFDLDSKITDPLVAAHNSMVSPTEPRWFLSGCDAIDCNEFRNPDSTLQANLTTTITEALFFDEDWDGTSVDFDQDPVDGSPLVMGVLSAADNDVWFSEESDANYKTDNISDGGRLPRKRYGDEVMQKSASDIKSWVEDATQKYWTHSGLQTTHIPIFVSDRMTGRPILSTKLYQVESGGTFDGTNSNEGALPYSGTPVSLATPNLTATVAKDGEVTLNVVALTGPSGGDGSNYELVNSVTTGKSNHIAPDHGLVLMDYATNTLTYKPRRGYTGTDYMYCFIRSGLRHATVRVDFLVGGSGSGIETPVVDTHFAVSNDLAANTVALQTFAPPDTDGRKIRLVQYSTDGGSTWRRLSTMWVQAIHKITVESDGTAISNGSYNFRLRYKTDFDRNFSNASSDDAVLVT